MKTVVKSFYNWYSSQVRHPKYRWIVILGTLIYLFFPFDLSPDFLPIMGWIDDGVVLSILTAELSRLVIEQRSRRQEATTSQTPETVTVDVESK
jgi:uncharacterized membrane protein YkvA (DUF1232 family)